MDKIVVTVVSSAGVLVAAALVLLWRDTGASERNEADATGRQRLGEALRVAAAAAAAGLAGGFLTFGLGGRLMMRVLAATSPDAQGFLTDADERVGEVTAGGTIFLVLFLTLFSVAAAGLYVLFRRWLPRRSVAAGLVAGGIGGGLLARPSGLVDPENRDFDILTPTWLAVLLCVALIALGAVTIAVLADRFVRTWPPLRATPLGAAAALPLLVYAIPPIAFVGVALLAWHMVATRRGRTRRELRTAPVALLSLAALAGAAWVAVGAVEILT